MQKILFHFEIRYYREHIMSKPNQSKSMKSLRNGRSLRLEGLETRQLLSANMLGAMQSDAVESAIVSSETTTDCTAEAMLAIAQQTAPQSYASAQLADLLPTSGGPEQGEGTGDEEEAAKPQPNPALAKVSVNYTVTATNNDMAVTIKNMDKLSRAASITIRVVDAANENIVESVLTQNEEGVWEGENATVYFTNYKTMTVQINNLEDTEDALQDNTKYTVAVVAEDAAGMYQSKIASKSFRTAKADSFEVADQITVAVNEADPTSSVVVTWAAPEIGQEKSGETRYAEDYTVTLYTVKRGIDGDIVEYKKARTVTVRDLANEDGTCSLVVKSLKAGTEYAATVKAAADAGKTVSLESAFSAESATTLLKLPNLSLKKAEVTDSSVSFEIRNAGNYYKYADFDSETPLSDVVTFNVTCTDTKTKEIVEVEVNVVEENGKVYLVLASEDLKPSTNYSFEISGTIDGVGATAVSKMSVKTEKVAYEAPAVLEQVVEESTYNSMKITWETSSMDVKGNDVAPAKRYTISYAEVIVNKQGEEVLGKVKNVTATVKSGAMNGEYTIKGLKANTTYVVTVAAAKDSNYNASAHSDILMATTAEKLERPSLSYNYNGTVNIDCGVDLSAMNDVVILGKVNGSAKYLDENGRPKTATFKGTGTLTDGIDLTLKINGITELYTVYLDAEGNLTGLEGVAGLESLNLTLTLTQITGINADGQMLSWKGTSTLKIKM